MSVALAGRVPATFEIKSATLPLVALLLKSPDLAALAKELHARFGDKPDFFDHDAVVIDLASVSGADIDFAALVNLLRSHRVHPVAVRGGTSEQVVAARVAGLARADELVMQAPKVVQDKPAPPPASAARPAPPVAPGALVIDRPLRSGQQVYARGRDLVVMAMVNAGAEVVADGSIHVYAPLRGKAMAGARGFAEARILTLSLEPELISIAGVYRTSDVPLPPEVLARPTQIRLEGGIDGRLVMDPLDIR